MNGGYYTIDFIISLPLSKCKVEDKASCGEDESQTSYEVIDDDQ